MRKLIVKLLILIVVVSLPQIGISAGYFADAETVTGNTFTAGYWEDAADDFYFNDDQTAVGFILEGVFQYDFIIYSIEYERDPGVLEHIDGTIDNSSHQAVITREWFDLGSCSSGGICVYHTGIEDINLEIDLLKEGVIEDSLHASLSL